MTSVTCTDGYFLSKLAATLNNCIKCVDGTVINAADAVNGFTFGRDQVKTCSNSAADNLGDKIDVSSYVCNDGYTKASIDGPKYGCVSCAGISASRILENG